MQANFISSIFCDWKRYKNLSKNLSKRRVVESEVLDLGGAFSALVEFRDYEKMKRKELVSRISQAVDEYKSWFSSLNKNQLKYIHKNRHKKFCNDYNNLINLVDHLSVYTKSQAQFYSTYIFNIELFPRHTISIVIFLLAFIMNIKLYLSRISNIIEKEKLVITCIEVELEKFNVSFTRVKKSIKLAMQRQE
ncbi:hypothetical protein [Candidatus Borreliella tachyglossi]|uniref:hypothetical protein n=1 Tax=Candidatus Borreliella tachyglossi TaxID=1964448 RepID=UPI004042AA28